MNRYRRHSLLLLAAATAVVGLVVGRLLWASGAALARGDVVGGVGLLATTTVVVWCGCVAIGASELDV